MEFDDYLKSKKIDPDQFKERSSDTYAAWREIFDKVHPDSFTQQKLFLLNKVRRSFLLVEDSAAKKTPAPNQMRPKIKPLKPKTN